MAKLKGAPAIGIDLGTSSSCVGVWKNNSPYIIPNESGKKTTPSYVAFTELERLFGETAENKVITNPTNTIFNAKSLIGRRFTDLSVQRDFKFWPFKVVAGDGNRPRIAVSYNCEEKMLAPEEISSMVLGKMREIAEKFVGSAVKKAVVTVPACFNDAQRQATKDSALIAGLEVMQLISEPIAVAIFYGYQKNLIASPEKKTVVVFDLGGGTFDASVLTIEGKISVKASAGHTRLGGDDFTNKMVNHFVDEFERKKNKVMTDDLKAMRRLWMECEKAKKTLSTVSQATIKIDPPYQGIDFSLDITQAKFEEINMFLFYKCTEKVEKCLKDAKVDKGSVDDVVLVGGSTRIPKVRQLLEDMFSVKKIFTGLNKDEAVASGATILATILSGSNGHNNKLYGHNNKLYDMVIRDATPLSLGLETSTGSMNVVIPRNTAIPVTKYELITLRPNNNNVVIRVYEGEKSRTRGNDLLGQLELPGIHLDPRGVARINVCFNIDEVGVLRVSAEDKIGEKKKTAVMSGEARRLSKEEIKRMMKEAKKYRDNDERQKKNAEAKNELENYAYKMRDAVEGISQAAKEAIQWLENNQFAEADEYEEKMEEMEELGRSFKFPSRR